MTFPVDHIRKDFPLLSRQVYGRPLIYLDNGATTQKPEIVIETINRLHREDNASIHRSVNFLGEQMTTQYEAARETVRQFIHARSTREVVFTSGATGAINAVAGSFTSLIKPGDEIVLSTMEHHSNIVPWQMLRDRTGAVIRVIPVTDNGELDLENFSNLLTERTKLVTVTQVSNSLGTINPVKEMIGMAHEMDIPVLIDGAQGVQHGATDVQLLDCDFYVFSGHKVYGPTGIGVLYGKEEWLEKLPPYQGGGDMIDRVTFEKTSFNELPFKFEAGTTNYIGAIGLAEALNYLQRIGIQLIAEYEAELRHYAESKLTEMGGVKMYGEARNKIPIFSFVLDGIHPYDTGMVLDKLGIAVRTGTHCTMPLMEHFGIDGTIRASFCFYNTKSEVDQLVEGLLKVINMFG